MFADDLKIFSSVNNGNDKLSLQKAVDNIFCLSAKWQLKLSESKCSVLRLGAKNNKFVYSLNSIPLEISISCRDLSVIMTPDGKFSRHIQNITKTSYLKLSHIFKIFKSLHQENLLQAYKAYVRPSLEYCSIVWSPHYI